MVREPLTNSPERGRDREAQLQPLAKVIYPTVPWWRGEIQVLMDFLHLRPKHNVFTFVLICIDVYSIWFARLLGNRHRTWPAMTSVSLQN